MSIAGKVSHGGTAVRGPRRIAGQITSVDPVTRGRALVLVAALSALTLKLIVAATTFGTNDVRHWQDFVAGVAAHGPAGVYGVHFARSFYNHPPVIGYLLEFVAFAGRHGFSVGFTIRAMSSLADVATAVVVFEILRRRRPVGEATMGALAVAASPVLFIISGFHGNTDPIFLMLTVLAVHLLADRDRPAPAGVAAALAVGIKIVPVVVLPALLIYALTRGRRTFVGFAAGFLVTFGITWGPALLTQGRAVSSDVLGYRGSGISQWGWVQLSHFIGDPGWVGFLLQSGRFLLVVVCAAGPAWLVWRRPAVVTQAAGIALAGFLFLSPAFGTQYLVWGLAAYLFSVRWATVYAVAAGLLLVAIYTDWAGGFPWHEADWQPFTGIEVAGALVVWGILGAAVASGVRNAWLPSVGPVSRGRPSRRARTTGHGSVTPTVPAGSDAGRHTTNSAGR